MKTIEVKLIQKTEHTKNIEIPSYWTDGFSYYRLFERKDKIRCDIINDWAALKRLELQINQSVDLINFNEVKPITKQEWMKAMDLVISALDLIINEEEPQGEDSFYHLHRGLYPTHPEKE